MSLDSVSAQQQAPIHAPTATVQVIGTRWAVAAGHALAAEAAARVLVAGGNAIDAGVAAGLTLGVVHPDMVSVAGVAPILVHVARTGETFQVSGVGPYPRASSVAYFRERHGGQIPPGLPRTVVPAAPDAWLTALERWGTMSFGDVARAATEHAERGFPVSTFSAYQMATNADKYRRWPTSVALFLRDERAYRAGEILVQRELGETLRRMARAEAKAGGSREGGIRAARDEFYRGETARRIAEFHRASDGPLTDEDLAEFGVEVAPALTTPFGAWDVAACGLWCQGPVLLQMLNLLNGVDLAALGHNERSQCGLARRAGRRLRRLAARLAGLARSAAPERGGARQAAPPHARAGDGVHRRPAVHGVRHAGRRRPATGDAPGLPQRYGLRHGAAGRGGGAAPGLAQLPRLVLAARDGPRQGGDRAEDSTRDP